MECHTLKFEKVDVVENYVPIKIGLGNRIWCWGAIGWVYVVESWGDEGFGVMF